MLVSEGSHHNISVPVVSIVGMGGLGKTTLAQLVFNADKVISHFERTVWVCVSDPFDVIKLVKIIAKKFGENVSDDIGWEDLLHLLCKFIKGKQFLLVLDDVWTEDHENWNPLMAALNGGARGCRIVVTTRSERVALMMGSTHIHNLGLLSENDSWSLFRDIAFAGREKEKRDKLEKIGMVIQRDMLIKLWMSQGYITSKGRRELESIGAEYFDTLAMRSFFQDFEKDSDGIIFRCKMHDLLHDLAQILTQNECIFIFMENNEFMGSKVRHLTAWEFRDANSICSANNIRTLRTRDVSIFGY
ncbi:hypothetical protein GIB67_017095 [Kingdonia uniflora]|uniref:Uncharacterized protein n=1 Tax=Kingdonia uniflora TaxID=39325 RepID=A0A7J7ND39_9MAGN|nr:hypothetical protein GIB67_017095 [Kingdonia uniflora]